MSRVVVVTGASAGLGRAVAERFAETGAKVGLIARGVEGLEVTAKQVVDRGGEAVAVQADVAEWPQVHQASDRIEEELGPLDIWVNNAMVSVFAPFKDIAMDDFRRATEVDYLGFVHGTKAALEHMLPRNRGVIVQVGSALALRSIPLQSAYCGAKHAVVGFTESLRSELIHDRSGVKVTMVHMPALNTPQFEWVRSVLPRRARPVAPVYQPEVGADAVCFAANHPRKRYYVGASTVLSVLMNRFAPGALDWYLGRTGYDSQQDDAPEEPGRPDNLFGPVAEHHSAHGRFDAESRAESQQLRITKCLRFLCSRRFD